HTLYVHYLFFFFSYNTVNTDIYTLSLHDALPISINLCKELKAAYPEYHFVPVYWMATEDHDFEEINYFHFNRIKFQFNKNVSGPDRKSTRLNSSHVKISYAVFCLKKKKKKK